jgi:hypothetical protein
MRYVRVVDSEFEDLQLHAALAKNSMFLRPSRNGTVRLSFTPPFLKDQTTMEIREDVDQKVRYVSRLVNGSAAFSGCTGDQSREGLF